MPQSLTSSQTNKFCWYLYRELINIYCKCHNHRCLHRRIHSVSIYFICHYHRRNISSWIFFFREFSICKTISEFFFPTVLVMKWGITEKRHADEDFPLAIQSVKNLPMKSESYTDGFGLSVKL